MRVARIHVGCLGTALGIAAVLLALHGCGGGGGEPADRAPSDADANTGNPDPGEPPDSEPPADSLGPEMRPDAGWAGHYQIVSLDSGKCLGIEARAPGNNAALIQYACDRQAPNQHLYIRRYRDAGYRIVARHSGRCLAVQQYPEDYTPVLADGAVVVQYDCTGNDDQIWQLQRLGGAYRVIARHSGKCMSVRQTADLAPIVQSICGETLRQRFHIRPLAPAVATRAGLGGKIYRLVAARSDQCARLVPVAGAGKVVQEPCAGEAREQWRLQPSGAAYRIVSQADGTCLDIASGSRADGAFAIRADCDGSGSQRWFPQPVRDAYQLAAGHSNRCLAVAEADPGEEPPLVQADCDGSLDQQWYLREVTDDASRVGQWGAKIEFPSVPVAAALLPDGKVLAWASWDRYDYNKGHGERDKTYTAIYDPVRHEVVRRMVDETAHDMFCPGTAMLPDGRVHVAGGGPGTRTTSIFDFGRDYWTRTADMAQPRWYNTSVTLPDGSVFTLGGHRLSGVGDGSGEIWQDGFGWSPRPGAGMEPIEQGAPPVSRAEEHPRLNVAPDGRLFSAGPSVEMHWYDPDGAGSVEPAGVQRTGDEFSQNGIFVTYGIGRILKAGGNINYDSYGSAESPSNRSAYVIDIRGAAVQVERVMDMHWRRAYASGVVLADGKVLVVGGLDNGKAFSDDGATLIPELFDPASRTWAEMAPMPTPRTYHSVALLLPDGRVFAAGGGLCGDCDVNHPDAEIFSPPYLFQGERPDIVSAPDEMRYGFPSVVTTDRPISRFNLIRVSSVTHTVNTDQRLVPLEFEDIGTHTYELLAPGSANVAPPGFYMLFALRDGVPSIAKILRVGADA